MSQDYSKSEKIGDHNFEIFMLSPKESLRMLTDLGKMMGPALGSLASEDDGDIGKAINLLFENVDNEKLDQIMDKLAEKTMVDGKILKGANFNMLFIGKIGLMFKWISFALKAQYSDFLGEMAAVLGGQGEEAAKVKPLSKFLNT